MDSCPRCKEKFSDYSRLSIANGDIEIQKNVIFFKIYFRCICGRLFKLEGTMPKDYSKINEHQP